MKFSYPKEFEKDTLVNDLIDSVENLQRYIVKNSVDDFDRWSLNKIEDCKNVLEVVFETLRKK